MQSTASTSSTASMSAVGSPRTSRDDRQPAIGLWPTRLPFRTLRSRTHVRASPLPAAVSGTHLSQQDLLAAFETPGNVPRRGVREKGMEAEGVREERRIEMEVTIEVDNVGSEGRFEAPWRV